METPDARVATLPVPVGRALRAAADRELARAGDMLARRGTRLHDGVHQGRKSLRRTRAALALAAPALGRSGRIVDRELRRLLERLSDLRDGQALVEALRQVAARAPASEAALLARAGRVAERRRADLARAAGRIALDREGLELIATLRASLAGMPWERLDAAAVVQQLRDSEARLADCVATVRGQADDDEAWHDWRRRARRLSQQQRLLAGTALAADRAAQHRIAERLGATRDLDLLLAHCRRDSPFARDDRRALASLVRALRADARDALLDDASTGGRAPDASPPRARVSRRPAR